MEGHLGRIYLFGSCLGPILILAIWALFLALAAILSASAALVTTIVRRLIMAERLVLKAVGMTTGRRKGEAQVITGGAWNILMGSSG